MKINEIEMNNVNISLSSSKLDATLLVMYDKKNQFGTKYFLYDVSKPHLSLIMFNNVATNFNQSTANKRP